MNTVSPELDRETAGAEPAWKVELQKKLAAARARRAMASGSPQSAVDATPPPQRGRTSVAAAVAARYAKAPTYSELLAREAQAAAVAAERAALEARAAAEAVRAELDATRALELEAAEVRQNAASPPPPSRNSAQSASSSFPEPLAVRLDVDPRTRERLQEYEARIWRRVESAPAPVFRSASPVLTDPVEESTVAPITPLAANLIEFPRELVAPKKARPRLAEGPLRTPDEEQDAAGLRIFEVSADAAEQTSAPERQTTWTGVAEYGAEYAATYAGEPRGWSLRLDAPEAEHLQLRPRGRRSSVADRESEEQAAPGLGRIALAHPGLSDPTARGSAHHTRDLKVAPWSDRLMAAVVDGALVLASFFLFSLFFCISTAHLPSGRNACTLAGVALAAIFAAYQSLFFAFSEGTPGMRYARIALCTFDDENPTRAAMRRRVGALLLSTLPAGLGLLWAFFDEDGLGWHDRISGMYQRSYR